MFDQAIGCAFLVEDSDHDIAIFEYAARRMKFPITLRKHTTGFSALSEIDTFNQLQTEQLPALFILDISIPDVDGISLCKRIFEVYAARGEDQPKIVFLTSRPTDEAVALAQRFENINIHSKPVRLADYLQIFQAMSALALNPTARGSLPIAACA